MGNRRKVTTRATVVVLRGHWVRRRGRWHLHVVNSHDVTGRVFRLVRVVRLVRREGKVTG